MISLFSLTFVALSATCVALSVVNRNLLIPESGASDSVDAMQIDKVKRLQTKYLLAFYLMMMGDWLQGPSTYPMYRGHGLDLVSIGRLFVVGYLSAAAMGPFVGTFCDRFGRKRASMMLCVTYSLCCLAIMSNNVFILALGRVMGGMSSSLIHSAPEAWLTNEHFSSGFSSSTLSTTFALATFGNGLVAIVTGLISDTVTHAQLEPGQAPRLEAPFYCAIFFFMASLAIIATTWSENYGNSASGDSTDAAAVASDTDFSLKLRQAVKTIWNNQAILATGMIQTLFETSMYVFVFLWGPVLESVTPGGKVPFGLVFSNLMLSLMIGSIAFRYMLENGYSGKDMARLQVTTASFCFLIPVFFRVCRFSRLLTFLESSHCIFMLPRV